MTDTETRTPTSEAESLDASELMPFAAAIPHARRLPKLYTPNPGFNSAEHRRLGDAVKNFGVTDAYYPGYGFAYQLTLAPDLKLTYGQIVALAGDLYGIPDKPISDGKTDKELRDRFDASFNTLLNCDRAELAKILAIMDEEQRCLEEGLREGKSADQVYADGPDFDQKYMEATGFGWAGFKHGRYMNLALNNLDHFGDDAVTTYRTGHARAIEEARAAYDERFRPGGSTDVANQIFERALAMNAFADHFLTDLFAAGHLRVPRRAIAADFTEGHSAAVARHQHIEDNHFGLFVRNAKGQCWKCFGDSHFATMQGNDNRQYATRAIQISYEEVYQAYLGGHVPTTYAALAEIPLLDLVKKPEPGRRAADQFNFAPAFIMQGDETQARIPFKDTDSHDWSRLHYRNFANDDRTSSALMFNNVLTGKSIENIKTPHTVMPPPVSKPALKGWKHVSRAVSPIGDGLEVRWAIAYVEDVAFPDRKGAAANVSALGPWSDYVRVRASETPVLTIPADPSGRSTRRWITRQIKGMEPSFGIRIIDGNDAAEWTDNDV